MRGDVGGKGGKVRENGGNKGKRREKPKRKSVCVWET